jgi:hypothetical protein
MEAIYYFKTLTKFRRATWWCTRGDATLHGHQYQCLKATKYSLPIGFKLIEFIKTGANNKVITLGSLWEYLLIFLQHLCPRNWNLWSIKFCLMRHRMVKATSEGVFCITNLITKIIRARYFNEFIYMECKVKLILEWTLTRKYIYSSLCSVS